MPACESVYNSTFLEADVYNFVASIVTGTLSFHKKSHSPPSCFYICSYTRVFGYKKSPDFILTFSSTQLQKVR